VPFGFESTRVLAARVWYSDASFSVKSSTPEKLILVKVTPIPRFQCIYHISNLQNPAESVDPFQVIVHFTIVDIEGTARYRHNPP
jgi:hypothetical protein